MNPLLSVIVPFYGVEAYLADCLDSILAQTLTDFEVVLVDDGSRDGSIDIAREYVSRDARVRLVRQENAGLGPARNTGVRHARGTYLMFVDSDDLLAPRAFQLLVGSLEESGSDFAVGNAWRFSRAIGTRPSWTHQVPCATTLRRTNVREFPALIRDRMVWNKVYRRSFWDAGRYEFPAIRYEDFPVTLKAHLDAAAVDVLSERIYLWRERESGESITQQMFNVHNAHDRVASAGLVLDLVDAPDVPDQVREDVHAYFIGVDLVALAGALVEAGPADGVNLEMLAASLAQRLHPQAHGRVPRLAFLIHKGLRERDFEFVRALARWRASGDRRALVRELRHRPTQVPAVLRAVTPRRLPQNPFKPRRLRNRLVSAGIEGADVVLVINAKLRRRFAKDATVSLRLRGVRGPVGRTEVTLTDTGMRITAILPATLFGPEPRELRLRVANGLLRWASPVRVKDPDLLPPVLPLGGDTWGAVAHVPGTPSGLSLAALRDPIVGHASLVGDEMHLALPGRSGSITVTLPSPSPDVVVPLVDGVARFTWEHFDNDVPDNPYSGRSWRQVFLTDWRDPDDPSAGRIRLATKTGVLRRGTDTIALGTSHSGWCHLVVDRHLDEADRQAREAKL